MEIILGKTAGFCYGVKKAVTSAEDALKENKNLYCLGEIVHNKTVVESLTKRGLNFIDDIKESKGKTIIRAHGIPKEVYNYAKNNNIEIFDFTCPNVLKIHKIAEDYEKKGYYIFLLGKTTHPENIGTISYCGKNSSFIEDIDDLEEGLKKFKESNLKKLLVLQQTTFSVDKFHTIEKLLKEKVPKDTDLVIKNTICKATEERQKETKEISKQVDFMIIIGGKNSSNTKKLYDIAKSNCKNAISIEEENDINIDDLKGVDKVGVMAGASTPKIVIDKVIEKLGSLV